MRGCPSYIVWGKMRGSSQYPLLKGEVRRAPKNQKIQAQIMMSNWSITTRRTNPETEQDTLKSRNETHWNPEHIEINAQQRNWHENEVVPACQDGGGGILWRDREREYLREAPKSFRSRDSLATLWGIRRDDRCAWNQGYPRFRRIPDRLWRRGPAEPRVGCAPVTWLIWQGRGGRRGKYRGCDAWLPGEPVCTLVGRFV